jgi:hypothetical protein
LSRGLGGREASDIFIVQRIRRIKEHSSQRRFR